MVEMQSACFCSSGSTLKPCFSTVTPLGLPSVGMPRWLIHDRKGYSLPKNQTPRVRPGKCFGDWTPVSLRQVSIMPEVLNGWAMLTRSEEHTSELQSLMRISYAVFCLKKKTKIQ